MQYNIKSEYKKIEVLMKTKSIGRAVVRVLIFLLVTVLLLLIAILGVLWVVLRGPSTTAQELLTRSLKETSAIYWIPEIYLPAERIAEIMDDTEDSFTEEVSTDSSLVTITASRKADESGDQTGEEIAEEDIEVVRIKGASYSGVMLIVKDPERVIIGTPDSFGGYGLTLEKMLTKYDAIGGINGGSFKDENGTGHGGTPEGIVITDGNLVWDDGTTTTVIGIDNDGILHVGKMSGKKALERNLKWACSFGPALIVNGEAQSTREITTSGVNPRSAIGQRADGAILLLCIEGRQISSLGATYEDLISIFLEHGAVNAANLDGGSSTKMIYDGEEMIINSSVIGSRPLPTCFLITR